MKHKILVGLLIGMFILSLLPMTYAWIDKDFERNQDMIDKKKGVTEYGKYIIEESKWYDPLRRWTKKKIKEVELNDNTEVCADNCFSQGEIVLLRDDNLIDDIIWKRSFDNGNSWVDWTGFTNYKVLVENKNRYVEKPVYETICDEKNSSCESVQVGTKTIDTGKWERLDMNKVYDKGKYEYRIEGGKKPTTILDWQIKTDGVILDEWAVWGYEDANISGGLVSQYKLNDWNYTNIVDSADDNNGTGSGKTFNDGTTSGGVTIEDGAMVFDGDNDYIDISSANIVFTADTSICLNIKISEGSNDVFFKSALTGTKDYLSISNISNRIKININGTSYSAYPTSINSNQFYHLCLVRDSENLLSFYLDNNLIKQEEVTGDLNLKYFGRGYGSTDWFKGSISNVLFYDRALTSDEKEEIYNAGRDSYSPISDGLVAQYSGRDYAGTEASPTTIYDVNHLVEGKINEAISFDGVDDYVEISHTESLNFGSNDFTVGFWVNSYQKTVTGNNRHYLAKYPVGASVTPMWVFERSSSSSDIRFRIRDNLGTNAHVSSTNIDENKWYFIVGVRNGNNLYLYEDGIEVGSVNASSVGNIDNLENIYIGRSWTTNSVPASIDDVRIYNRSLSQDDIDALYNDGAGTEQTETGWVVLNNPADGSIQYDDPVTFNTSLETEGGAYLTNASLWTNESGSFDIIETATLVSQYYLDDDTDDKERSFDLGLTGQTYKDGIIGDSLWTDGNQGADSGIDFSTFSRNELTINFWINVSGVPDDYDEVFHREDGSDVNLHPDEDGEFELYYYNDEGGKVSLLVWDGGTSHTLVGDAINLNDAGWEMITLRLRGNETEILKNTTSVGTNAIGLNLTASLQNLIFFGASDNTPKLDSAGIDEIKIYDKWLSDSEISNLYNDGNGIRDSLFKISYNSGDSIIWNVQGCDTDGDCGFAEDNRTFSVDDIAPTVSIETPTGTLDYGAVEVDETLNTTITDSDNLDSCWYNYNGTNVSFSCSSGVKASELFELDNLGLAEHSLTVYANDTLDNENSETTTWNYTIFQTNENYDATVTEGSVETFDLNVTTESDISEASLIYDSESYSSSWIKTGNNYSLSKSITIPGVTGSENKTFYWSFIMSNDDVINSSSYTQEISDVKIDDCSNYTNELFNLELIDEETQIAINETTQSPYIYIDIDIYSLTGSSPIMEYSTNFTDSNTGQVCLDNSLNTSIYTMNAKIKYGGADYRTEYYNIRDFSLNGSVMPQNITLYDILIDNSESFTITMKDDSFLFLSGALIDITREYVDEGKFKSIEIPITDDNGKAVASLSPGDTTYTMYVWKDGELVAVFENVVATCQDILTGECNINLNAYSSVPTPDSYDSYTDLDLKIDYDEATRQVTASFSTYSGEVTEINLSAIEYDVYSNNSLDNDFLKSSSGTLYVTIPENYQNQTVIIRIEKDGDIIYDASLSLRPEARDYFGMDVVIFAILALITIPLMFISSTVGIVLGGIIGLIFVSLLMFSGSAIGITTAVVWLILAGVIIIWKMTQSQGGRTT